MHSVRHSEVKPELELELKQLYLLMNSTLKGYMEGTELEFELDLELDLELELL